MPRVIKPVGHLMVKESSTSQTTIRTDLYKGKDYLPLPCFSTQEKGEMPNPCPKKFWLSVVA